MANHEIFYALTDLFNEGEVEVKKDIANKVAELAIEVFPDFRMTYDVIGNFVSTKNGKVKST